jgi:hypothetical protein
MKTHGILVLLAVAILMTSGGVTAPTIGPAPPSAAIEALALAPVVDFSPGDVCSAASDMAPGEDHAEKVPPGCCSTQCNVDKDCNRICGKGVCACIQETSCCRRCVY